MGFEIWGTAAPKSLSVAGKRNPSLQTSAHGCPYNPAASPSSQVIRKISLHFIPLNPGQKISVDGERQRDAWAPEFPLPSLLALSGFENTKQGMWGLGGPICDLKLLWGPCSECGWISLGWAAGISATAEGTRVRLCPSLSLSDLCPRKI